MTEFKLIKVEDKVLARNEKKKQKKTIIFNGSELVNLMPLLKISINIQGLPNRISNYQTKKSIANK